MPPNHDGKKMIVEILTNNSGFPKLEQFHETLCKLFDLPTGEQRFSDNVAGGSYHRTDGFGVRVRTELSDDREFPESDFTIRFEAQSDAVPDADVEAIADRVAIRLATLGFKLVRLSTTLENRTEKRRVQHCTIDQRQQVIVLTDVQTPPVRNSR